LDNKSDEAVQRVVREEFASATNLVVAHRLGTLSFTFFLLLTLSLSRSLRFFYSSHTDLFLPPSPLHLLPLPLSFLSSLLTQTPSSTSTASSSSPPAASSSSTRPSPSSTSLTRCSARWWTRRGIGMSCMRRRRRRAKGSKDGEGGIERSVELCCLYLVLFRFLFTPLRGTQSVCCCRARGETNALRKTGSRESSGCGRTTVAGRSTPRVALEGERGEGELRAKPQQRRRTRGEGRKRQRRQESCCFNGRRRCTSVVYHVDGGECVKRVSVERDGGGGEEGENETEGEGEEEERRKGVRTRLTCPTVLRRVLLLCDR
jgi:hypothetical protein